MVSHPSLLRVLIVDDEPAVALTLAASLEKLHDEFIVDTAYDFAEAFSQVQRTPYTLLVADYKMPGMNGLDLARAVRRVSPDTQIVLMTAYGTQELRNTVELLSLADYLEKPFTLAQIRELVQRSANGAETVRRILIFENPDDLRRLNRDALRNAGYKVYEATSLQAARDLLAQRRFDIFICTLGANGIAGVKLMREQAAHLSQSATHVIVISTQGAYRPLCEEIGVEFFLETPVSTSALVTLLTRLTENQ